MAKLARTALTPRIGRICPLGPRIGRGSMPIADCVGMLARVSTNVYIGVCGRTSGHARAEANARAGLLRRRGARAGRRARARAERRGEGARRPDPPADRRRAAAPGGRGLRLRPPDPLPGLAADALPPPAQAARRRRRGRRAAGPVGVLLRRPGRPRGALHMAELTDMELAAAWTGEPGRL